MFAQAQRQRRQRKEDERDITAEEVEEITDDQKIKDDPDDLAKKAMMEEWDTHMADFVPDDMMTVQLNAREEIVSSNYHHCVITFIYSHFTRMLLKNLYILEALISLMRRQAPRKMTD